TQMHKCRQLSTAFGVLLQLFSSCFPVAGPSTTPKQVALLPTPATKTANLPFSMRFDWTKKSVTILPAENWGLFKERDTVVIETVNNSPITVFDLYGKTVYSGRAPAFLNPKCGHYFVECKGDRNQFAVLPYGYAGASFLGAGATTNVT